MFLGVLPTGKQNMTNEEVRRLNWRCRRGLLELDIILQRFSEQHLATLTQSELSIFDRLLDLSDNEFLEIVTSRVKFVDVEALSGEQLDAVSMKAVLTKLSGH